jgi:ribosomal protein L37AE/L43A
MKQRSIVKSNSIIQYKEYCPECGHVLLSKRVGAEQYKCDYYYGNMKISMNPFHKYDVTTGERLYVKLWYCPNGTRFFNKHIYRIDKDIIHEEVL